MTTRELLAAAKEAKDVAAGLSTEEKNSLLLDMADALRAALEHERQVGRLPDLRKDFHGAPAARAGGQRPQLGEGFLPDIRPSLKCPVCLGGLLVRVNHNVSREAVGDDNAAVVETAV